VLREIKLLKYFEHENVLQAIGSREDRA